jgi:hypothetical protein
MKNFKDFINEGKDATSSYPPPKYLVQPAEGDKGFFMLQAQFDALNGKNKKADKKKFTPKIQWKFADE